MAILSLILSAVLISPSSVSFDLREADLCDFFAAMGMLGNINIVLHPAVVGKIDLNVRDVDWNVLLDVVLKNYSLAREINGNVMRIVPLSVIEAEYRQQKAREDAEFNARPLETRIYQLNYAKASDMALLVSKLLSPRGTVIADARRNIIIVRDVAR